MVLCPVGCKHACSPCPTWQPPAKVRRSARSLPQNETHKSLTATLPDCWRRLATAHGLLQSRT